MEYKEIVKDVKLSALGMGTGGIGGLRKPDTSEDTEAIEVLRTGLDLGMTHIDTAEMYGVGHAEELIGKAIEPYDRDEIFLTTKVSRPNLGYQDLITSIKGSLKHLEVDYIDLYLIHWPNPEIPLKDTMKALETCIEEGYTRFIGVANFTLSNFKEAQSYLSDHRLVALQLQYSLMNQTPMKEIIPYCIENQILFIAYTPLAKGNLARPAWDIFNAHAGNSVLDELAEKYGKTQAQLSLNWIISQESVVTIPKSSRIKHLKDNVGAVGWKLTKADFQRLGNAFL